MERLRTLQCKLIKCRRVVFQAWWSKYPLAAKMSGVSTTSTTTLKTDVTSKVLPGDKSGLPLEIWQIIFSYLSVRDLCCVAGVSKTWYDLSLSMDSRRWKELYLACREWRHPYWPLNVHVEPSSWKQAYRNQYLSTRFWYRCSRQAHKAGCMTLLKVTSRQHTHARTHARAHTRTHARTHTHTNTYTHTHR